MSGPAPVAKSASPDISAKTTTSGESDSGPTSSPCTDASTCSSRGSGTSGSHKSTTSLPAIKFHTFYKFILSGGVSDRLSVGPSQGRLNELSGAGMGRIHWMGRVDCMFSLVAAAVGLGNVTHFPYLAQKHGAGTFLFPFILVTIMLGVPLFYLEACVGQLSGLGTMLCWNMIPLFKGVGLAIGITSVIMSVYYAVFSIYPLFYFGSSFIAPLPWSHCNNPWNTKDCIFVEQCDHKHNLRLENGSCFSLDSGFTNGVWNLTAARALSDNQPYYFSSQEYWIEKIAGKDGEIGSMQPHLVLCLFVVWLLCYLALARDVLHLGKIMIFNVMIMFMVMIVLVINSALLPYSSEGIMYFLTPKWDAWKRADVWYDASGESFFGAVMGVGIVSTMTSFSHYRDGNPLRMSVVVVVVDALTSIFSGFVFFARVGYLAHQLGQPIETIASFRGSQLAYLVYPESILKNKVGPFLSLMFFLALSGLGITSEIAFVHVSSTALLDYFPNLIYRRYLVLLVVCLLGFLLGLPFTLKGGNRWASLLASTVGSFSLLLNGLLEVVIVAWLYGITNFYSDIEYMIGRKLSLYFAVCWKGIIPVYLTCLILWTLIDKFQETMSTGKVVAWLMASFPVVCLLLQMAYQIFRLPFGTLPERVQMLLLPDFYWTRGPVSFHFRQEQFRLNPTPDSYDMVAPAPKSTGDQDSFPVDPRFQDSLTKATLIRVRSSLTGHTKPQRRSITRMSAGKLRYSSGTIRSSTGTIRNLRDKFPKGDHRFPGATDSGKTSSSRTP